MAQPATGYRPRLLYLFRADDGGRLPSFAPFLEAVGWRIDALAVSDRTPVRGIPAVFKVRNLGDYDVVAASEYWLIWALALRLLFRPRPRLIALSFNQSGDRLARTGSRLLDKILNRVWRRVTLFVVHSREEARLFSALHDISPDRFKFSHWGYDLPMFEHCALEQGEYVTMVGRNNRDLATFCAAVERAGTRGVLITASYMLERNPIDPPDCVKVLADRPMEECLAYVAGSFAHLVLVNDANRGAGHISAVSAMLLGKPQIFSAVAPLADYLQDGVNGNAVPVGDAEAAATAIRKLRDDPSLAEALGSAGRSFAREHLSDEASAKRTAEIIMEQGRIDLKLSLPGG